MIHQVRLFFSLSYIYCTYSEPGQWFSQSFKMDLVIKLLMIPIICQMFRELNAGQCRSEYSIGGMMLKGHTFIEKMTTNWLECLDKRNDDVRCQSVNYAS